MPHGADIHSWPGAADLLDASEKPRQPSTVFVHRATELGDTTDDKPVEQADVTSEWRGTTGFVSEHDEYVSVEVIGQHAGVPVIPDRMRFDLRTTIAANGPIQIYQTKTQIRAHSACRVRQPPHVSGEKVTGDLEGVRNQIPTRATAGQPVTGTGRGRATSTKPQAGYPQLRVAVYDAMTPMCGHPRAVKFCPEGLYYLWGDRRDEWLSQRHGILLYVHRCANNPRRRTVMRRILTEGFRYWRVYRYSVKK